MLVDSDDWAGSVDSSFGSESGCFSHSTEEAERARREEEERREGWGVKVSGGKKRGRYAKRGDIKGSKMLIGSTYSLYSQLESRESTERWGGDQFEPSRRRRKRRRGEEGRAHISQVFLGKHTKPGRLGVSNIARSP